MASFWLTVCSETHAECNRDTASCYFPTRVLDIQGLSLGRRSLLVQDSSLQEPYVALSHRWGVDGLPSTTSDNLAERLAGIDVAELSPTMRDAIHIVESMGYRYLWIDALYILQNSAEDWISEASKMSSVFSGAAFTIAVADAVSHSRGIFRKRLARCMRPFHVQYQNNKPYRRRTHTDGDGEYYIFPKNNVVGTGARDKGALDIRGWTLQEQVLSTRVLYFDHGEIFWECISSSASESSPMTASLLDEVDPDEAWALKLIRKTLANSSNNDTPHARIISDAWFEIIKNYSARELTRQSDRLIALQGIIRPLSDILNETPLAGMWREQLWRQLTW
jgi:hypothetical protein